MLSATIAGCADFARVAFAACGAGALRDPEDGIVRFQTPEREPRHVRLLRYKPPQGHLQAPADEGDVGGRRSILRVRARTFVSVGYAILAIESAESGDAQRGVEISKPTIASESGNLNLAAVNWSDVGGSE